MDCIINFDLRLIDLFQTMSRNAMTLEQRFMEEYERIREMKGHRPSRMDLFTEMDGEVLDKLKKSGNPLRNYFAWLHDRGFLNGREKALYDSSARDIIHTLETTNMSRLYKMPVLMAFIDGEQIRDHTDAARILEIWKQFFAVNENWKDPTGIHSLEEYRKIPDKEHLSTIRGNPVHFLDKSSKGVFVSDGNGGLLLGEEYRQYLQNPELKKQWEDIISYRTLAYFRNRNHSHE